MNLYYTMTNSKNLNIPAILIRTINGKEKQIAGKLISINESANTCSMCFKNGKTFSNIPMNNILVNEGFIDKVKEYGKNVVDFIKRKVKGFIMLVDDATGKFLNWSALTVANFNAVNPVGIKFAPSATLAAANGIKGLSIDEAMAEPMHNDRVMIEKYWRRVIKRAGTTDEPIEESVKFVNENFYTINPAYKALNETVVYSLEDINSEDGYSGYGSVVDAKELKNKLIISIRQQLSGTPGKHADANAPLIWGAPGIGKTAIINSVIKNMANRKVKSMNLSLITIMLAGYTIENWTLPKLKDNALNPYSHKNDTDRFTDCPKTWLPVYLKTSDPEEEARRDHYCNTGEYRDEMYSADGRIYEGGIVFMDEYSRTPSNVQNIIMGLINDHKFGDDFIVASKWGFVFAANRAYDDSITDLDDRRYNPVAAQNNRFVQYTYVPKKEDWLEWANDIDPITHKANVPPFITEFIAQAPDHVWYSTVKNGGYDDMLMKSFNGDKDQVKSIKSGKMDSMEQATEMQSLLMTKRLMTPRTWANKIGPAYENQLITLLEGNSKGLSGQEMYQELLDKSVKVKTDSEGNTYKEYYGGILPNVLIPALNDIDADYWDEEYEIMGGDSKLDPSHQFVGRMGRYNKLMAWVRELIAEQMTDVERNSPVLQNWDDYNSYAKYITDDVIESIWQTGEMPADYRTDDDTVPNNGIAGFNSLTYSKWKATTQYQKDIVLNRILPAYPGNIYDDMAADVEACKNVKITKEEAEQILNDAAEKCKFTVIENGKEEEKSFFFNIGKDLTDPITAFAMAKTLKASTICNKFLPVLTWIAKVRYQTDRDAIYKDAQDYVNNLFKMCPDHTVFAEFMNVQAINAAISKFGKTSKEAKAATASVISNPITHMFLTMGNMRIANIKGRRK